MDKVTQVKTHLRLEQWKKIISECQNSGMPVRAWCVQNGFKEQSYYYYLKKIREQAIKDLPAPIKEEKPVVFQKLEVQPPVQNTKAVVIIRLPNAVLEINEGASQQTVQAVLLALQNICQAISLLSRTSTLPVATQICASPLTAIINCGRTPVTGQQGHGHRIIQHSVIERLRFSNCYLTCNEIFNPEHPDTFFRTGIIKNELESLARLQLCAFN